MITWTAADEARLFTDGAAVLEDGRLIVFTSSWGGGSYPTWIGRDEAGAVVCFVTDLLV